MSINSFSHPDKFAFETVHSALTIAPPRAWMAKVDIKSAYRHVPLHPSQFNATGLKYRFSGDSKFTYFYDTRLMFGASESVGTFHRITQSVVRMMYRRGFRSTICYLDDFLILEKSETRCKLALDTLLKLLQTLGFEINGKKLVTPTQRITFLGIVIDMNTYQLYIPHDKLTEIKQSIYYWLHQSKASKRQLQSIIGKVAWGAKCVKAIRPILRSLIDLQTLLKHPSHRIRLSSYVKANLRFFYDWCVSFNGVPFCPGKQRLQPDATVYCDSSSSAAGAFYHKDFLYCAWPADFPLLNHQPIFIKELCAILLAFHRWPYHWRNKRVQICTDNKAAEWVIRKGLSKHSVANAIVQEILWISAMFNITISVTYIPSENNCIADAISRMHDCRFLVHLIRLLWAEGVNISDPQFDMFKHMTVNSYQYLFSSLQLFKPTNTSWIKASDDSVPKPMPALHNQPIEPNGMLT